MNKLILTGYRMHKGITLKMSVQELWIESIKGKWNFTYRSKKAHKSAIGCWEREARYSSSIRYELIIKESAEYSGMKI